jgi:hypothetical protein
VLLESSKGKQAQCKGHEGKQIEAATQQTVKKEKAAT